MASALMSAGEAISEISYWPALTMVYEKDGATSNGKTTREVHRLEYRSVTDWTDTVIESDPIEFPPLGTESTAGSYQRLKGKKVEFYDSTTNDVSVDKRTDESIYVPNAHLIPLYYFVANPNKKNRRNTLHRDSYNNHSLLSFRM